MKKQIAAIASAVCLTGSAFAATIITGTDLGGGTLQYDINFNGNGNTAASGNWDSAPLRDSAGNLAAELTNTLNPEDIVLQKTGGDYSLSMDGTFGFWLGANNASEPVTSSAWYYTTAANASAPTFTISGLTAGDKVSLWATLGWDAAAKAPQINFNGLGNVDINIADTTIGTNPGTGDLVLVASEVVATGSTISGVLNFPSSGNGEGQIGAMIIRIESVPEPSAALLLLGGLGAAFGARRRAVVRG